MKDILKCIGILFVGLFVSIILYPLLHETGHYIVTVLAGGRVADFNLLPVPSVVCEVTKVGDFGKIFIALGGIGIPFFISMLFNPENFWLWYINLLIKGISVYAILLSAIAVFSYMNGVIWDGEDIILVLQITSKELYWLLIFISMTVFGIGRIFKEKPILRCCEYFEMTS